MRILSIKLKNINSLRGEWELDFTQQPLKDAGLFAMIGKMGSGKSTILDCITLALFNAIPRYTKVSKDAIEKGGLILTKNERDCYAEVKYSCKSGVYTSRWSISKTRNDTLRDYEMQVFDEQGKPLTDRKTEVPNKNAELIGLSYDQFNKSILLSQGEFAKFLKSSKNERAQLLEEITATKDFRRLGRMAWFVYGRKKKEIDTKLELIKSLAASLLPEEELDELKIQIAAFEDAVRDAETQRQLLKARVDIRRRVIQLQKEIVEKERKVAASGKLLEDFENKNAETLRHYSQLLPFKEKINEYVSKEVELVKHNKDLKDFETRDWRLETRIGELINEVSVWLKKEITADNFFDELEAFKDKVSAKLTKQKQLLEEVKATSSRINTAFRQSFLSEERALFSSTGSNELLIQKLNTRVAASEILFNNYISTYQLDIDQLVPARIYLQESLGDLGVLQTDVRNFLQNDKRIKENTVKQIKIQSEVTVVSLKFDSLTAEQENLEIQLERAEEERKEMFREDKLDEYRFQLVKDEPCPVCGSTSHPFVHEYARALGKAVDRYDLTKQDLDKKRKEVQEALVAKSSTEEKLSAMMVLIARDTEDNLVAKQNIDNIKEKLSIENIGSVKAVAELITEYQEKLTAMEFCIVHLSSKPAIGQLLEELENFDKAQNESTTLNKEILEMYSGKDIQADYKQRREAMQSAIDQRKEIQSAIGSCKTAIKTLETTLTAISTELLPQLSTLGYEEIKDAKAKIISESVFHQLTQRRGELSNALQLAKKLLSEDIHRLQNESANDDASITIESLLANQQAIELKYKEQSTQLENLRVKHRMDEETRKEIQHIEENIQDQRKANLPWELLCRFIGDKTGNTFNNFAQELTLKHLLNFANRRLQKLHSRYILSMPLDDEDDDLVVVDTNMGNERRSVKTLSGGETFIISLSLALGLSDLASRDVLIESLFIDEGFGTLDPEVLEVTIGTLEQLQAESNKTVGIISHVDSMRERIYTQVQLEKQQNGFSTMKIYPETS